MDINDKLLQVTKTIEQQVDSVIEQIDQLDAGDLESLRKSRMKELKAKQLKRKEWLSNGHGVYNELPEEKQFFEVIKKSENVILHFYTNSNERCKIVDMHFKIIAPKHEETLFTKVDAEKCPFLTEKLKIKVIPSIVCIHNGIMVDKLVGFTTLGNRDDFSTADMEWRLAQNEVIEYEGDLSVPPSEQKEKVEKSTRKIRSGKYNGADDDDLDIVDFTQNGNGVQQPSNAFELTPEEEAELGLDD
ncbi:PREDICTED: thioredoxin domain-containing protein 9 [Nicrophorus vespilloides]|uniref:Thioredoxin domain-containing protein 9 n=1 Tax=Nicrophorus vespilloides TaxID=110193 RepID=A0ABM1MNG1_NICVS|nr:PREDICTED: thioredoxin domain-containing protein 9 [Nicrophorus vespilloides]